MIYDKDAVEQYKISQRKISFEKVGSSIIAGLVYYFGGIQVAILLGLVFIIYSLCDIRMLLSYQNFMKEKDIGVH